MLSRGCGKTNTPIAQRAEHDRSKAKKTSAPLRVTLPIMRQARWRGLVLAPLRRLLIDVALRLVPYFELHKCALRIM